MPYLVISLWWSLVKFGFRLLYNELAFTYDLVSRIVSLGAWHRWQRQAIEFLEHPSSGLILELAHGTGTLQGDLYDLGYNAVGIDFSCHMGAIAHKKLTDKQVTPQLARSKAQELPFVSGGFSAVISTFPTGFILDENTLREVHRILCADGRLIIVPNATLIGSGIVKRMVEFLYRITGQRGDVMEEFKRHIALFGFSVETVSKNCSNSTVTVVIATKKV